MLFRSSNTLGGAKLLDAQAGYESATTLMAVCLAGANYIWHSAGWNEGGLHCSMAKFVVDAEQCAMAYRMAEGVRWDDFDEAIAAVADIGPASGLSTCIAGGLRLEPIMGDYDILSRPIMT